VRYAEGLVVYFGAMPAEVVRGHPRAHPESQMHGRGHESPGEKHVVIALFDAATGARITDATVSARVVGSAAPARALERMTVAGATQLRQLPAAGGDRQPAYPHRDRAPGASQAGRRHLRLSADGPVT
jgi:hypothetical protein